jgi:putative transposase
VDGENKQLNHRRSRIAAGRPWTFVAALRHDGITAPWLIEGPTDGESFRTYIERGMVPTLRPGDIVVLDNLGSNKGRALRALIRACSCRNIRPT